VTWHRKPLKDLVDRCFRCGLCRAVCPVFLQDGREPAVARAKLQLVGGLSGGDLPPGGRLATLLSRCLSCGACEAICPADVAVTEAVLRARGELVTAMELGRPIPAALKKNAPASGELSDADAAEALLTGWNRYLQVLRSRPERPLAALLGLISGQPAGES
jgi:Fe-S oxidoreductase